MSTEPKSTDGKVAYYACVANIVTSVDRYAYMVLLQLLGNTNKFTLTSFYIYQNLLGPELPVFFSNGFPMYPVYVSATGTTCVHKK